MKRTLLLAFSFIFYASAFADFGFYQDAGNNQYQKVVFDFGSGNEWKRLDTEVEGTDYQTKNVSDNWLLKGGEAFVWQDGSTITGLTCHYRIYKDGGTVPGFSDIAYSNVGSVGGNNYRWENIGESIDILSFAKETGTYWVEFYYSCTDDTKEMRYFGNGGSNYKLFFTSNIIESSTDLNWADPSAWHGGAAPQAGNTVRVVNEVTIESAVTAKSIRVKGGDLQIYDDGSLTIAEILDVLPGASRLRVYSSSSGTGSLIVEGSASGIVSSSRYVTNELYHYVSSPLSGQAMDETWLSANWIVNTPAYQMWRWDEDNNYWIIYGSTGDPEAFTDIEFVESRGYMIERSVNGGLYFEGEVRTDDVQYAASYTAGQGEGFNMVGNPFPSSIAITEVAQAGDNFLSDNATVLDDSYEAIYIWDEQAGYSNGRNDYKVICNAGFVGEGSGAKLEQDHAALGQGFIVKVNPGGGDILFNADTRKHAGVDFYKSKESWPGVEVYASSGDLRNSTVVTFNENMSNGLDVSYDAAKIKGNPKVALYTNLIESNGEDYAVQALPLLGNEDVVVPMGLDVKEAGVFEFSANAVDMESYDVLLEDRNENVFTNLKNDSYFANVSIAENGRFFLHFKVSTGIEDDLANTESTVNVYANGNLVRIETEHSISNAAVSVFNTLGQQLKTFDFSGTECRFNLSEPGTYIVKTQSGKSNQTHKVIIY
jgi:hypothetical protein